jgi:hypothetical protein
MLDNILHKIKPSKARVRSARLKKPFKTKWLLLMSAFFYIASLLAIGMVALIYLF